MWGRRRVGKTALVQHFAADKRSIFLTGAGRGEVLELVVLAEQVAAVLPGGMRDLAERPYTSWDDALDDLATRTAAKPMLLVLDEFPELVASSPALPGILRAFLDRVEGHSRLRVLLCGSAVRHMEALQDRREPLYGRFDLALLVHPFSPHEAALMLPRLDPADRAVVYGLVGGMPLYLSWWDQSASVRDNLRELVTEPGARLLTEGDNVLRTDVEGGEYARQVLTAIAAGRTQHGEIRDAIRAEPSRTLDRLIELRLVERVQPVGEAARSRRRIYRIVDPFLRFHLGVVGRYRSSIERGLGESVLPVLVDAIDEHMGDVWEEAFRSHLRWLANARVPPLDRPVVALGSWWDGRGENQLDALALGDRSSEPFLAGEAKWALKADAGRLVAGLRRKVEAALHVDPDALVYAVCARRSLSNVPEGTLALTAADLFSPKGD